jgi:thioredoxin reductase
MSNAYDVVIIGAGIAGMKAATTAAKYGLSYKIIEANDYIGMFSPFSPPLLSHKTLNVFVIPRYITSLCHDIPGPQSLGELSCFENVHPF